MEHAGCCQLWASAAATQGPGKGASVHPSCQLRGGLWTILGALLLTHVPPVVTQGACDSAPTKDRKETRLTAGRAKKETPMRVNVAARSLPFQVWGYLSP